MRSEATRRLSSSGAALMVCVAAACGGDASAICEAADAQAALDTAGPSGVVTLGACEVAGPLRVPSGVTLAGVPGTIVTASGDSAGVVLAAGDAAASVQGLAVRSSGRAGIVVRPGGTATVTDVSIEASAGVGIGAQDVGALVLERVSLTGPITVSNADESRWLRVIPFAPAAGACPEAPCDCEPGAVEEGTGRVCDASGRFATVTATYGLYLEDVEATLIDVQVAGFASFGAALGDSDVVWTGGAVTDTLGVAVRQTGGDLEMNEVSIERTHQGVRGMAVYGLAATTGAVLAANALTVSDNDRYGVVVLDGSAALADMVVQRNGDAGIWAGETAAFSLTGASLLADNAFAGVVVADASGATIDGASVDGTAESLRAVGELSAIAVGDGLHVMGTTTGVEVRATSLSNNERAGALFDLGAAGTAAGFSFAEVSVEGTGEQLGAVAGSRDGSSSLMPIAPGTWDTGISRLGATAANDTAITSALDVVGAAAPGAIPDPAERVGVVVPMF